MLYQLVPSVEYSQTPPVVAALPVMAMPASVVALEPALTVSVASEYSAVVLIKLLISAPVLDAEAISSATLARVVLPLETGASLTAVTLWLSTTLLTL